MTLAFVLLLLVVVAACSDDDDAGDGLIDLERGPDVAIVIATDQPIVLGFSAALIGPIGPRGNEYLDAVVLGVERWKQSNGELIGGHEIEVRAEDDGCSEPGVAAVAAERFTRTTGLVGVIGPQCSGGAAAEIPILADAGIVAISGSATLTDLTTTQPAGGFFFRTAYRNDLEGMLIGLFVVDTLQAASWYLIDDGSAFGVDLADAAQAITDAAGVLTIRRSVRRGDVDFSNLAAEIAADRPDIVVFTGLNPEASLILRQIRDRGGEVLFGAGDGAASQTAFVDPIGEAAEGALFYGCRYPPTLELLDDFKELHGYDPSATFVMQYVDAATILLDAVNAVAVEQDDGSLVIEPTALRDEIRASYLQDGASGAIRFDVNGDRVSEPGDVLAAVITEAAVSLDADIFLSLGLITCQVQDGKIVPIGGVPGVAREPRGFPEPE